MHIAYVNGYTEVMGMKANEVTDFAKQVMRECVRLQKQSGMTVKEFAKACGFGEDYWYKRQNYTRPLTLSDLERISNVVGTSIVDIVVNSKRHAIDEPEYESRLTDELIDLIAAHPEDYDVAANRDEDARIESQTPDE